MIHVVSNGLPQPRPQPDATLILHGPNFPALPADGAADAGMLATPAFSPLYQQIRG